MQANVSDGGFVSACYLTASLTSVTTDGGFT